ncbi:lap-2 [Symbiodinium sp. KB8]|nr:lap-2 [Symbiodinium sp. KB8]
MAATTPVSYAPAADALPTVPALAGVGSANDAEYDAVVFVTGDASKPGAVPEPIGALLPQLVAVRRRGAVHVDKAVSSSVTLHHVQGVSGSRLIVSPTGPLDRCQDDVRALFDAAEKGVARAKAAGATAPIIVADPNLEGAGFPKAQEVLVLGAAFAQYSPLQTREFKGAAVAQPIVKLGFLPLPSAADKLPALLTRLAGMELGRRVARDICGADPARMTNLNAAEYVKAVFAGVPGVTITCTTALDEVKAGYPCAYAVARASELNPLHHPAILRVEYKGAGPIEKQVFFAGKGITYDTGGADIKAGGIMAGMKHDCGGAAAAAGFMRSVAELAPAGLRAVAYLGFVRNDVGSTMYVADEIITSHAGKRVLVVNTDAEGRMVMCDLLSHIREEILGDYAAGPGAGIPTTVHSIATLTGHAVIAYGVYNICLDNGVSKAAGVSQALVQAGDAIADPFEVSTLRREDFAVVTPRVRDDHDFPAAFLAMASGLAEHGTANKDTPIAYTHLDIAGSASHGDSATGVETGNPVPALVEHYIPA